jgi:hypothetical protein
MHGAIPINVEAEEKVFTIVDGRGTWVEGPGEWSYGMTQINRVPYRRGNGTPGEDGTIWEAEVSHAAGIEGTTPDTDTGAKGSFRFQKVITFRTAAQYATEEEADAAIDELVAYLKSTGQMPEEPNWRKYED